MRVLALALATALGLATPALAQAATQAAKVVTGLVGRATIQGPDGTTRELALFDAVPPDAQVQTGADGGLELTSADGSVVRLGPGTTLMGQLTLLGHAELRAATSLPVPGVPGATALPGSELVLDAGPRGGSLAVVAGTARQADGTLLGPGDTTGPRAVEPTTGTPTLVPPTSPIQAPVEVAPAPADPVTPAEATGLPTADVAAPPGALTSETGEARVELQ